MTAPVTASESDLRVLAGIVSENRSDLPDGEGLPPSLLADLMGQIRCDGISLERHDSGRQETGFLQLIPVTQCGRGRDLQGRCAAEDLQPLHWQYYWDCQPCSYPDRTGDLCSIVKITDFYSARQWHSTGMYTDVYRPQGAEHELQLFLPDPAALTGGPSRTLRLSFFRGSGPDFSERERAVLTLLRPHLKQIYLDTERRRHPVPRLTPRQWELLHLLAAGRTNTQIARRLGISEGTVRTHLENIYERLAVSSRTAAVARAFRDRAA
jgi:DNA-binding CsgD family transcriptional regulator